MIGYRNAVYDPREEAVELFTWDDDGNRIVTTKQYKPYLYIENMKGGFTSIFNTPLQKKSFNSTFERYKFIKESGQKRLFENFSPVQQFLIDEYFQVNETEEFTKFPLKIYYWDIETPSANEFPNAQEAKHPIQLITIYCSLREKFFVWGLKPYTSNFKNRTNVDYVFCNSEIILLEKLIEFLRDDPADIITGWNTMGYDNPYIINRIRNILGEDAVKKLSPYGGVYSRTFPGKFGKEETMWHIDGISLVDYLDIYKKFKFVNQESYRLDAIGEIELGENKIDYGGQSLYNLMIKDWNTFVDYNIQDVHLVVKLEEKLQFLALLRMLAYTGLTTFEGAMGTLSIITGATAIRARKRNQCIPTFIRDGEGEKNPGAFVADPIVGFQTNVVSFDANSLYPNVMISCNMSPETKIGKIISRENDEVVIRHANGQIFTLTEEKFKKFVNKEIIAVSKANVLFSQKKKGIIPEVVDHFYKERVNIKRELKKLKKELADLET